METSYRRRKLFDDDEEEENQDGKSEYFLISE
jgi:hypothetical protein